MVPGFAGRDIIWNHGVHSGFLKCAFALPPRNSRVVGPGITFTKNGKPLTTFGECSAGKTGTFCVTKIVMLETLLYPKAVAVIGASRTAREGRVTPCWPISSTAGSKGAIVPVNPGSRGNPRPQMLQVARPNTRARLTSASSSVAGKYVKDALQSSINAGAKSVIVITAGFREVGAEGAKAEQELVEICRQSGVRMVGPNCLGVLNTDHHMNATFAPSAPPPGKISVISQSGALCVAILDWAANQKLGLGKVISFGNKADLNEVDFIQALAEDKATKVIAGYLESIKEGDKFLRIAEQAAAIKPVVILKVGITQAGAKAASSHTGSLAGADIAYGAAFKRAGVIRAENFEALFDYATAFAMQPLPNGERVAIITNAGGPGIMAADAAESAGLENGFARRTESDAKLRAFLPASAAFGNPD